MVEDSNKHTDDLQLRIIVEKRLKEGDFFIKTILEKGVEL